MDFRLIVKSLMRLKITHRSLTLTHDHKNSSLVGKVFLSSAFVFPIFALIALFIKDDSVTLCIFQG